MEVYSVWVQVPPLVLLRMNVVRKIITFSFFRYFLSSLIFSFFVIILVLFYSSLPFILNKNLGTSIYLKMLLNMIVFLTPKVCVIASSFASILCISQLDNHSELTAMKSIGVSFRYLLKSFSIVFFFIISFVSFFSHYLSPVCKKKTYDLVAAVENMESSFNVRPGVFISEINNLGVYVGSKGGDTLNNIVVFYRGEENGGFDTVIIAEEGKMNVLKEEGKCGTLVNLMNGANYYRGGMLDGFSINKNAEKEKEGDNDFSFRTKFNKQDVFIRSGGLNRIFKRTKLSDRMTSEIVDIAKKNSECIEEIKKF